MASLLEIAPTDSALCNGEPLLHNGDHLTGAEFLRRYAAMPDLRRAELIEGVVYMPSPVSDEHARPHFNLNGWMFLYGAATPGVAGGDNGTLRLDANNVPQPDGFLRILASHGGQTRIGEDGYVIGGPEFIGEVAVSSVSIDLHSKLRAYERNNVREYVVWRVTEHAIDWFILRAGHFERLQPSSPAIYQSQVLPGLWLDAAALIRGDLPRVLEVARQGLASPEHAAFVARLLEIASPSRA